MTTLYGQPDTARAYTVEFHNLRLVESAETNVYSATVNGTELFWETVVEPSARELLDAALTAYREERALQQAELRADIDRGVL